jgi:hypothetical protein
MFRAWYPVAKEVVSLRKHILRVDLCVWIDDIDQSTNASILDSQVKSILMASISKGLDIIGIVNSQGPNIGLRAAILAKEQNLDITVMPGQSYKTQEGQELFVYKLSKPIPQNLTLEKVCQIAKKSNGFVMARNAGKRKMQILNKLKKTSQFYPDAVEIYNANLGGYFDIEVDYPRFISSGATSANDLESINSYTLLGRKDASEMGLIQETEGIDYTPDYLENVK